MKRGVVLSGAVLSCAVLAAASLASAGTPLESVSMSGNLGSSAQLHWLGGTLDASDPFDVLVGPEGFTKNTNASVASPIDASSAVGLANASASVTPDALTVSGHCTSSVSNNGTLTGGEAFGSMDLFFVITIPEGETYTWSFRNGSVSNLNTTVTFRQGDAILFESDPADTDWTDSSGGIPGGEYVVEVLAAAYSNLDTNAGEPQDTAFDFTLVIRPCPCTADFDQSGGTPDINDISAYFEGWLSGDPAADSDCSGGTPDTGDINDFFTQWLNGGC